MLAARATRFVPVVAFSFARAPGRIDSRAVSAAAHPRFSSVRCIHLHRLLRSSAPPFPSRGARPLAPFRAPTRGTSGMTDASPRDAGSAASETASASSAPLVQYVVLREDLWSQLGWPLGPVVAQACHASAAALWESRESASTQAYCAPEAIRHMTKVLLQVKDEKTLLEAARKLGEAGVAHHLWIEEPEGISTALATAPVLRDAAKKALKKARLCSLPIGAAQDKA